MRKDLRVLRDKIIDLHQSLQAVYPSHHWNHINVFQAYWNLVVFTESELGKFGFFNSLLRKGMDALKTILGSMAKEVATQAADISDVSTVTGTYKRHLELG